MTKDNCLCYWTTQERGDIKGQLCSQCMTNIETENISACLRDIWAIPSSYLKEAELQEKNNDQKKNRRASSGA